MAFELDFAYLVVVIALTLRLSVLASLLPLLSGTTVPPLWRVALALGVALATAPAVVGEIPPEALNLTWPVLVAEGLRSLMVGALLATVVGIPFAAVRFAGEVIGVQIGFAMVNTVDPQGTSQISVVANFYYLLAVMLFFALDGHGILLGAMVQSCVLVPPLQPAALDAGAWQAVGLFGGFFSLGLRIAAPVIVVLLLANVAMGFVVKTVPQINILVVGFPITIAVGLMVLGLSLTFYSQIFAETLDILANRLEGLLFALRV